MKTKPRSMLILFTILTGLAVLRPAAAHGQTSSELATEATSMDRLGSTRGSEKVVDKISSDFSSFLGSRSRDVVLGLRNGTTIELPPSTVGGPPVIITPPTGKMGFGNVFISLALAKQQLSQLGITQPTSEQLQAALLGGQVTTGTGTAATTTNLQGILTMRSQNMGWGQIAQKLGFKLGPIVSAMKSTNHSLAATSATSTRQGIVNARGQSSGSSESGIVSAGGKAVGKSTGMASGKNTGVERIVTGSGHAVGSQSGIVTGRGNAYGVTEASQGAGAGNQVNNGQTKGQGK